MIKPSKAEVSISSIVIVILILLTLLVTSGLLGATAQEIPEDEIGELTNFADTRDLASSSRDSLVGFNSEDDLAARDIFLRQHTDSQGNPKYRESDVKNFLPGEEKIIERVSFASGEALEVEYGGTDDPVKQDFLSYLEGGEIIDEYVTLSAKEYTFFVGDDEEEFVFTVVRWDVRVTEQGFPTEFVHYIPKHVAEDVSKITTNSDISMEVINPDPLIAFDIPKNEVKEDAITIEYYIEGGVLDDIEDIEPVLVERAPDEVSSSTTPSFSEPRENQGGMTMLIVIMMLLLILVVYVQYQHHHRN